MVTLEIETLARAISSVSGEITKRLVRMAEAQLASQYS
ncbi:spore protein [Bacillus wiedmannii]|uniref:Spore protein n=1 Tax=Bacillus wiedmannii TaxID=1890302 RepID=A0ABX5DYL2_9BACI|nr:spore protein [Bacillus wiedmannii]PRT42841.1 spore protein [Bacillus wiedmannii]